MNEIESFLATVPIFRELSADQVGRLAPICDVRASCATRSAKQSMNVVMTPTLRSISKLEFAKSAVITECGRRVAAENLPAIVAGYERLKVHQVVPQPN